jgi:hypothetical protein
MLENRSFDNMFGLGFDQHTPPKVRIPNGHQILFGLDLARRQATPGSSVISKEAVACLDASPQLERLTG